MNPTFWNRIGIAAALLAIQAFPISNGADADVYDPKTGLVFVSTREGWVYVFHEDSPEQYSEVGKVKTDFGAKTMAYDPKPSASSWIPPTLEKRQSRRKT